MESWKDESYRLHVSLITVQMQGHKCCSIFNNHNTGLMLNKISLLSLLYLITSFIDVINREEKSPHLAL